MLEPPPGNLTPACFMWRRTIMEIAKPLSGWKGALALRKISQWRSRGRLPTGLSLSIAASTRSKAESSRPLGNAACR